MKLGGPFSAGSGEGALGEEERNPRCFVKCLLTSDAALGTKARFEEHEPPLMTYLHLDVKS